MNPAEHEHRYLRPMMVALAVNRPFKTVDSWRRRGEIPSVGHGQYGQLRVCVCCAAEQATKTSVRWVKRARRGGRKAPRRLAA